MEKLLKIANDIKGITELKIAGGEIFLVGGIVRDSFLNKPSKDIDLLIRKLSIQEIKSILKKHGSIEEVGESFGVLKYTPIGHKGEQPIDITLPRTETKICSGHRGFKIISDKDLDIIVDLSRRDFCMNAIAININTGEIIDPFNGLDDIKNKIIRLTPDLIPLE